MERQITDRADRQAIDRSGDHHVAAGSGVTIDGDLAVGRGVIVWHRRIGRERHIRTRGRATAVGGREAVMIGRRCLQSAEVSAYILYRRAIIG